MCPSAGVVQVINYTLWWSPVKRLALPRETQRSGRLALAFSPQIGFQPAGTDTTSKSLSDMPITSFIGMKQTPEPKLGQVSAVAGH